jgi:hypothetical protein
LDGDSAEAEVDGGCESVDGVVAVAAALDEPDFAVDAFEAAVRSIRRVHSKLRI